jgi:triacylglycerol lipase
VKPTKAQILRAATISDKDVELRLEEFRTYKTLAPHPGLQHLGEMKVEWPDGKYFDIVNVEGWYGLEGDTLFIIFRGSDSLFDWIRNFLVCKKVIPYSGTNPKVRVHEGFLEDYKSVRDFFHSEVMVTKAKKILVYGHSMGAAMAALCALDLQYNFPGKDVGGFAIGMPRLGNKAFTESFNRRLPDFQWCDYGSDLVPQVPPRLFGYEHVATQVHLGPTRRRGIGTMKDHNNLLYHKSMEAVLPA